MKYMVVYKLYRIDLDQTMTELDVEVAVGQMTVVKVRLFFHCSNL